MHTNGAIQAPQVPNERDRQEGPGRILLSGNVTSLCFLVFVLACFVPMGRSINGEVLRNSFNKKLGCCRPRCLYVGMEHC